MNIETGEIKSQKEVEEMNIVERRKWRLITRDLTVKERCDAQIRLYAPCGCGSDKKFKFCCYQKKKS